MNAATSRLAIAGILEPTHVGQHFVDAAHEQGRLELAINLKDAFSGSALLRVASWRILGHRPPALNRFNKALRSRMRQTETRNLVTTGLAPITDKTLMEMSKDGTTTAIYLTDDPWNPSQSATWFFNALPHYDYVYSTRRTNLGELKELGCKSVEHLPFAFAPSMHFVEKPSTEGEREEFASDIVLVGGADDDRVPMIKSLAQADLDIAVYGQYWDRYPETKPYFKGRASPAMVRKAISGSKIALCLVRRANRDGSSMRTFEVPAMGGCPLMEDTEEHRDLFGEDGENVEYFRTSEELARRRTNSSRIQGDAIV